MLKVVGHRVLVRPVTVEEVDETFAKAKSAGIVLIENEDDALRKNAVDRGIVIGIGSTAYKDFGGEPWCIIGDEVVFSRYAGKVITDPETKEKFTCLNDEDVVCVIYQEKTE